MPQALAGYLVPILSNFFIGIGLPGLAFGATIGAIALGASYLALAAGAYLISQAFQPPKPETPKPEDGKYNLKQTVPPLVYVLGKVKKAGDYAFLEEKGGTAYHITVWAAHSIKGFTRHWLHDEAVTLNAAGNVVTPPHFIFDGVSRVNIQTRLGAAASTAYAHIVSAFPSIWTNDHRGDGLATVAMRVESVAAESIQKVFPQGMPQDQAEGEGHNQLIDPRTGTPGYSTNIPIFRFWHLTHPVGGKLNVEDMYLPDWAVAADVADQNVTNRTGGSEKRYHGGFWFRANNDPVQVGRLMDEASELVIYERRNGQIGVHPGQYVAPDIRLVAEDIKSISYDPNRRKATNVLAVRGRYTDPAKGFNTADAAIYGQPYPSDDERTKTVDNQVVQSHNHVSRLQKIKYIRANAPRVKVVAHYEAARDVPYRRFVRVHYPPRLTEAVIEIIGRPVLSLRSMTYEFEGIVVPGAALYAFDAATEEGEPGANVLPVIREDVPAPQGFDVVIQQESVGGGSTAAFALASVALQNEQFQYELEWQPTAGGATQQVVGNAGELSIRSAYLADGVQYRFRTRTWSAGTSSDWTGYLIRTATADPLAPGAVTEASAVGGAGEVTFHWTAPNSANYVGARLYLNGSDSISGATLVGIEYGAPNVVDSRVINSVPAGTWYGFIAAVNGSGVEATPAGTGAITVT